MTCNSLNSHNTTINIPKTFSTYTYQNSSTIAKKDKPTSHVIHFYTNYNEVYTWKMKACRIPLETVQKLKNTVMTLNGSIHFPLKMVSPLNTKLLP